MQDSVSSALHLIYRPDVEGHTAAGVASVLIWLLKAVGERSKKVQKDLYRSRDGALTCMTNRLTREVVIQNVPG
jgi:hypothetical protein